MAATSTMTDNELVPVTIEFTKEDTQPPIFVAGSFSDPAWTPLEMQYEVRENVYHYHKKVDVEAGKEYQYKFRIGTGDWWMLNETMPTAVDEMGNRNNLLHVSRDTLRDDAKKKQSVPDVAAEVADTAQSLDQEPPTPPISDEEAGRIGYRRMSNTPVPEVAETAAEVANTAARLDGESAHIDLPPPPTWGTATPGATTPWEERVPQFEHERLEPPSGDSFEPATPRSPSPRQIIRDADPNDPTIEEFPCDRQQILDQVRAMGNRLPEDEVCVEGVPPSPVIGAGERTLSLGSLPSPSPGLLPRESPSLVSIPEEGKVGKRPSFTQLPQATRSSSRGARRSRLSEDNIASPTTRGRCDGQAESPVKHGSSENANQQSAPQVEEPNQPNRAMQAASGASSVMATEASAPDTAISTAQGSSQTLLRQRGAARKEDEASPKTPGSHDTLKHEHKSGGFLRRLMRTIFVDWIGGFFAGVFGKRRRDE